MQLPRPARSVRVHRKVRMSRPILYMTDERIVLTTVGSEEEAKKIAHALVDGRLAACVNIVPRIESVYRWQGKVEEAQESLLIIKTTSAMISSLRDSLQQVHSYELPEFLVLAVEAGSEAYLNWVAESVG